MNHLAHVHLSGDRPELIVGNLAADYLRKRECLELPIKMQIGVALHRFIDYATDTHPDIREACAVLRVRHGKYASVIFDIYCDYLLSTHWGEYADTPHHLVAARAYSALSTFAQELPQDLSARFARMIEADWLMQYGSYDGLAYVFDKFGKRVSKPALLIGVVDTLRTEELVLAKAFARFYPWMQAACEEWRLHSSESEAQQPPVD